MNTLLALILLSSPLPWGELNPGTKLALTEKVNLGESGPSYPAGTILRFDSSEPLDIAGYPVLLLKLSEPVCEHPEWSHEMEIITPAGNAEASAVGVELEAGCRWGIYVEQKDLFQPSFFGQPQFK